MQRGTTVTANGPTILIVDDEPDMLMMLSFVLGRDGFTITTVKSGEEALDLVDAQSFDIVLTDLKMPGINGHETLRRLKELDPDLQVVVATGYATDETAEECRAQGAFDLIHKPFDVVELRAVLSRALDARAQRHAL